MTVTFDQEQLKSYDYTNAKTYILDAGDYYFTAATDSHNAVNNILAAKGYTVAGTNGRMTEDGDASLVWKWTNEALDATTYAASANGTAITNLQSQYTYYNSTLNSKTNITSVEETAGRLGLMKIDQSQITYIRLGESDTLERTQSAVRQWTDFIYNGAVNILGTVK